MLERGRNCRKYEGTTAKVGTIRYIAENPPRGFFSSKGSVRTMRVGKMEGDATRADRVIHAAPISAYFCAARVSTRRPHLDFDLCLDDAVRTPAQIYGACSEHFIHPWKSGSSRRAGFPLSARALFALLRRVKSARKIRRSSNTTTASRAACKIFLSASNGRGCRAAYSDWREKQTRLFAKSGDHVASGNCIF